MATHGDANQATEETRLHEQNKYVSAGLGFDVHPTIKQSLLQTRERKQGDGRTISVASISRNGQACSEELVLCSVQSITVESISQSSGIKAEWSQAFDIVAVRLVQSSMSGENFTAALQNIVSLVRPGGWIQWIDWDPHTVRVAGAKPGTSDQALRQLLLRYTDLLKTNGVGTTYKISTGFRAAGLEDDDSDIYPLTPDAEFTSNIAKGAFQLAREAKPDDVEQLDKLWRQVQEEIEHGGPLLWYDLWCHIARKP